MSETWIRAFLRRLDRMQPDEIVPDFAEDACLRIGNGETAVGLQSIRRAMAARFRHLRSMRHETRQIFCPYPGTAVIEADVHYVDARGRAATVVEATILRFEGQRIVEFRAFG